jgi:hypothetical protein
MATQKTRRRGGGWDGRKIEPRVSWWKRLGVFCLKVGGVIAALFALIATLGELQPTLVVEPQQHQSDIYKTEIVLHNKGLFDLEDVEVDLQFLWLELPIYIIQAMDGQKVFVGEKHQVADEIPKDNKIQFRLPNILPEQQVVTKSIEHSHVRMDLWEKVGVCVHISFHSFPYFSWRTLPFRKSTRIYGLMADREDTITFSDNRSCRYVEHWIKDHPISPTTEQRMRLYVLGGRFPNPKQ